MLSRCVIPVIRKIVWDCGKSIFTRMLDGVAPELVDEIKHAASHTPEAQDVTEVRVR